MTKTERIRDYVARNPQPDQSICPELIQYWKKRDGVYEEWHSKTGERVEVPAHWYGPGTNGMSVRSWYTGAYFKADGDMLEIATLEMPGNRGKAGVPKEWNWDRSGYRVFIFKGDPVAYDKNGYPLNWGNKTYYNEWVLRHLNDMTGYIYDQTVMRQIRYFLVDNFDVEPKDMNCIWEFSQFYKMNWLPRKRSKAAQNVLSYQLPEMSREGGDAQFEILDENYAVFRFWTSWTNCEKYRVFISSEGKVTITTMETEWRLTPSVSYFPNYGVFVPEQLEQWKPLKWIVPCISFQRTESYYHDAGNANYVIKRIIQLLRHPIVESLTKSGYPNIARIICANNQIPGNLKYYFDAKERKGNLYKILGANKWLLKAVEEMDSGDRYSWCRSEALRVIKSLKTVYGKNDISDLSKETIDAMFGGMHAIENANSGWLRAIFGNGTWCRRGADDDIELTDDDRKKMQRVVKFCTKHPTAAQVFIDTASMKKQMGDAAPDIDIFGFENENDLARMHNALIELREQQRRIEQARWNAARQKELEEQQKMFDKLQEKRVEQFEYEDDEFCIRVPHKLEEITVEGSYLHHCVGGYLGRHASGYTNIIFLRRKATPEVPFYTIEICEGRLVQIHGAHNRWLGNNPEAIPFVYEWLQQLDGVRFNVDMLLNKATGYGKSQDQLDTSYLYRKESVA